MSHASTQPATLYVDAVLPAGKDWLVIAETIAARLRTTAVERERAGAPPRLEITSLRDADLLTLLNPAHIGGGGATFKDAFRVVRTLARADTSIAQVLSYHYLLSYSAFWRAGEEQRSKLIQQSVDEKWFWGGASNPRDTLTVLSADGDGFRPEWPQDLRVERIAR